jgi:hypothetical protein
MQPWIDGKLKAKIGETNLQAGGPIKIEAAMANSFMREREVVNVVRKISASLQDVTFPITIDSLDGLLMDHSLTTGERICLKAGLSRAGLLRC